MVWMQSESVVCNFSAVNLEKVLAGKKASVSYDIANKTESVSGSCSPKDFETMMQLTNLTFTAPRRDDDAFASYKNRNPFDPPCRLLCV